MIKKFLKDVRIYIREYCNCTSIHGFRYFGEKRTLFEKIWWFFGFVACLAACVVSIYMVYRKWELSPVIATLSNKRTQIHSIHFPAVTVCPESKTKTEKFNYTDALHKIIKNDGNYTTEEAVYFEHMELICNWVAVFSDERNFSTISQNFHEIFDEVKPDFQIFECSFMGYFQECSDIFKPIITEEGVCYTFNMLDRSAMFRENVVNYKNYQQFGENGAMSEYPRRALLPGIKKGLRIELKTRKEDLDPLCTYSFQGYKVIIHNPESFPSPSLEHLKIPLDHSIAIDVNPSMISTSQGVRAYTKDRRGCYFPTERNLQYFKVYNAINCNIECFTNHTQGKCGCVPFWVPRNTSTNICTPAKADCMRDAAYSLHEENELNITDNSDKSFHCDCLPACTEIDYNSEVSQIEWDWKKTETARKINPDENVHRSALTIYFKNHDFISYERNELYGPIDFLANFGGLLGLFTGFSILSLIEIVYFLSVRILCNKYLYGQWLGEQK